MVRTGHTIYFIPTIEIKNYTFTIDGKNFFDDWVITDMKTYDNIRIIVTDQGDDYTIGCLLDYLYFKVYHKIIARDLGK